MQNLPNYNMRPWPRGVTFYDPPIVVGVKPFVEFSHAIDRQLAELEARWGRNRSNTIHGRTPREARGSSTAFSAE